MKSLTIPLTLVTLAGIIALALYALSAMPAFASAPSGIPTTVATTSAPTVGAASTLIIATSTCNSRIISTSGSAINLSFSDNQGFTPTAVAGFTQQASTTVAYDSGQYGCGAVRAYSFTSSVVTVSDTR
jgi:hypothetical protein